MHNPPKILIVDDEPFNVDYLEQELEDYGYGTISAMNGQEALEQVAAEDPDIILLDIMMPIMDGFGVLERLKGDERWRDIPVVIISAMTDIDSIVRGIKLGADDYLPKPFNEVLLSARISAGLERKRLRDNEREFLDQVYVLTDAAHAIEEDRFEAASVQGVAERDDELGQLARIFHQMAEKVHAREQLLRQQIKQLQVDIAEQQHSAAETVSAYVPIDRRIALAHGASLPEHAEGAALFGDISGFTQLSQALVSAMGDKRGAEELTRQLNQVYEALIEHIHRFGGSIIGFAGDSVTCWFDRGPHSVDGAIHRAVSCAFAMQDAMQAFENILVGGNFEIRLSIKIAIAAGRVRRFLVGDPQIRYFDLIAGNTVDQLNRAESLAQRGEILVSEFVASTLNDAITIDMWRDDDSGAPRFAVISGLQTMSQEYSWDELTAQETGAVDTFKSWLTPEVYEHVQAGKSINLSQFRKTTSLFLTFSGLDYESTDESPAQLDEFVRWFQQVVASHQGTTLQVTVGDKGNYLFAVFGAPLAIPNHALAALEAAFALREGPPFQTPIHDIRIGIASGTMRSGAYGSSRRRTYGNQGPQTNLAARLMQASDDILCDANAYNLTRDAVRFESLPPIDLKGFSEPVAVFRPVETLPQHDVDFAASIDQLAPELQFILKLISVFDCAVDASMVSAVHPNQPAIEDVENAINSLVDEGLLIDQMSEPGKYFELSDASLSQVISDGMLFGQRRQLHRSIASWFEAVHQDNLVPFYDDLAHHWEQAEDYTQAIAYLERAATEARKINNHEQALRYFNRTLALQSKGLEVDE